MTADEIKRSGTLALVIRWAHARAERRAHYADPTHGASANVREHQRLELEAWRELSARGVDLYGLASAIDVDGGRS